MSKTAVRTGRYMTQFHYRKTVFRGKTDKALFCIISLPEPQRLLEHSAAGTSGPLLFSTSALAQAYLDGSGIPDAAVRPCGEVDLFVDGEAAWHVTSI